MVAQQVDGLVEELPFEVRAGLGVNGVEDRGVWRAI
jgi:hypothetical protein